MFYKIRDRESGFFSSGGAHPSWVKGGKVWRSLGALKNHLHVFNDYTSSAVEVVGFEMVEQESFTIRLFLEDRVARKEEKRLKYEESMRREREKSERRELQKLLEKYPDERSE